VSKVVALRPPLTAAQALRVQEVLEQGVVETFARPLAVQFAGLTTREDLEQLGREGLAQAARNYRPEEGPFLPYARCRIRGAMLDSIRVEAFEARVTRAGVRAVDEVLKLYDDDFDVLRHDEDERQRRLDQFSDATLVATLLGMVTEAQKACSPDEVGEQEELRKTRELVDQGKKELPAKQQRVLDLLFAEGRTQEDAASILDRDVTTVRRNLKTALGRLRKWLSFHGIDMLPDPATELPGGGR
jgi:RNA polymerase sigma factor (sigma-70 family)